MVPHPGLAAFPAAQRVPARRGDELPGALRGVLRPVPRIRGVGIWLGGSTAAIDGLIRIINSYVPGLISENGLVDRDQVEAVAQDSGRLLTITGIVAVVVVVWTAIGFVTFTRRAVRDTFGLPFDLRNYVMLKARDFLASILFGISLLVGALLGSITTGAVDLVFGLIGWDRETLGWSIGARLVSLVVAFGINTVALASLFRFLTGTTLTWRRAWPGALVGATGIVVCCRSVRVSCSSTRRRTRCWRRSRCSSASCCGSASSASSSSWPPPGSRWPRAIATFRCAPPRTAGPWSRPRWSSPRRWACAKPNALSPWRGGRGDGGLGGVSSPRGRRWPVPRPTCPRRGGCRSCRLTARAPRCD